MNTELQTDQQSLYETDFLEWIETTAKQLRLQDYSTVDWENLIEEIESMGRRERGRLRSNLTVLLMHLLKWQYQPAHRGTSWNSSIVEHRRRIRDDLEDSPSLKRYLTQVLEKCYANSVEQAAVETGLPQATFPQTCPYSATEILDTNFLPESL